MDAGMRGLVLEDNAYMRRLLTEVLREMGVRDVAIVATVPEALKAMDADMLDFIRDIRLDRSNPQRRLPMIVVSGQSQKVVIEAARDAGANDFLIKPVSVKGLQARLSRAIEAPPVFIETKDYYGPDRRRPQMIRYSGPERRRRDGYLT
jgi:two-component system, chemotaxis family, chemotaxis protein CheY